MHKIFNLKFIIIGVVVFAIACIALVLSFPKQGVLEKAPGVIREASPTPLSQAEERRLQQSLDEDVARGVESYLQENPWADEIPTITDNYYIGFNNKGDGFFVYLYPKNNSSTSVDAQVENIKTEATNFLKKIGAPTNKIEWITSIK